MSCLSLFMMYKRGVGCQLEMGAAGSESDTGVYKTN